MLLCHVARHGRDLALWAEARELTDALPGASAELFLTGETPDTAARLGARSGRPDLAELIIRHFGTQSGTLAYLCGPAAFMDAAEQALATVGVQGADVRREVFASPGTSASSEPPSPGPFRVDFTATGISAQWRPEDGTLLDLAEAAQVPVAKGCRAGACQMCQRPLTRGRVAFTLPPALPPADGSAPLCISVPATDVVIAA